MLQINFFFVQTVYQPFNFMFFKFASCIMLYFEVMSISIHTIISFFVEMFEKGYSEGS